MTAFGVEDQRAILAKWVKDVVWQMGCTCREGEKFLTAGLADVLKPGYETFERPRFERGTCCELLNCLKVGEKHDKPSSIQSLRELVLRKLRP